MDRPSSVFAYLVSGRDSTPTSLSAASLARRPAERRPRTQAAHPDGRPELPVPLAGAHPHRAPAPGAGPAAPTSTEHRRPKPVTSTPGPSAYPPFPLGAVGPAEQAAHGRVGPRR